MITKDLRTLIADDHALIREGLKTILGFEETIKIIGEAINGREAIENAALLKPDIILMDVNMPDMTGIEVLKAIKEKNNEIKIIMITAAGDQETLFNALDSGADGYILKDSESVDMIQAIHEVYEGETYIDKRLVNLLLKKLHHKKDLESNKLHELTERELSVLKLISQGYTNREVSEILFLSEKTVKNYATTIFKKLEVKDRVQATLYAIKNEIDKL